MLIIIKIDVKIATFAKMFVSGSLRNVSSDYKKFTRV
jgi:hypothetical protein